MRFIHSADWQIGKPFRQFGEKEGILKQARLDAIENIGRFALAEGAEHVMVAGDVYDTEAPTQKTLLEPLERMRSFPKVAWHLLPGNHDSLAAETLWDGIRRDPPENVTVLDAARPVDLAPGVVLLPAPLPRRHAGRDLTDWMPGCPTPEGSLRLGLAHGGIHSFSEDARDAEVIPPDRAATARLDYLALGDWHGQMLVNPRTAYAGTPEFEGFAHGGRGACLAVTLRPGAPPTLERVETGAFHWSEAILSLVPGQDAAGALAALLPPPGVRRRDHLLKLQATGRSTLAEQQALRAQAARAAPDFAHFVLETTALETEIDITDLDALDRGGALRAAAEILAAEARDPARDDAARRIAAGALNRLYAYLREGA